MFFVFSTPETPKTTPSSSLSPYEETDSKEDPEADEILNIISKKRRKMGRKASWSDSLLSDMIDIIVNSEYYKRKLIFTNTKNQKNGVIYGNVLDELKVRACERE